ncbi:hypothetical protein B0H14DRAFT_3474162 [Mycena olivaceomarginata]|nr:hypothetical protein B0H14DRAFT_3474162 [Mycena olivaceomarginata]
MLDFPVPWPRAGVLEALVEKSSGYFIYAANVVAFVDDEFADPSERVEVLQNLKLGDTPFMALDQLYTQILTAVPRTLHAKLRDVLCVIVNFGFDLSATAIGALLNLGDDITFIMRGLHSVVDSIGDRCAPHHASFREFLEDPQRSSIFHIGSCIDVVRAILEAFSTPLSTRLRADALQRAAGSVV